MFNFLFINVARATSQGFEVRGGGRDSGTSPGLKVGGGVALEVRHQD